MFLVLACAPPIEVDRPFAARLEFPAADGVHVRDGTLFVGDEPLAIGLYEPPVVTPTTMVIAQEHEGSGRLLRFDHDGAWRPTVLLDAGGRPDRVALAPDGQTVAFVWGEVASVWTVRAGEPPRQHTNLRPGRPPPDFVPPPRHAPTFRGEILTWDGGPELLWR